MVDESLLIGETVVYEVYNGEKKGVVMGVVTMKFREYDIFPTTGYSVLLASGELENVPYHKVKGIVEPDLTFLELLDKHGDMITIKFPKYYKPQHPKGWDVEGEHNNDMPFSN